MAENFGIPQLVDYLKQMKLKIAQVNHEQEIIELTFHGNHGQWRMIVGIQQEGRMRKLMLIAPHLGSITNTKRLECLEALMAVNYRIAIGKFGLDLDDGEVRLEESIPLSYDQITFSQFKLAFNAILQTVSMYHSLLPRIVYGNLSVQDALRTCEEDFQQTIDTQTPVTTDKREVAAPKEPALPTELNIHDVLAEVSRILEQQAE